MYITQVCDIMAFLGGGVVNQCAPKLMPGYEEQTCKYTYSYLLLLLCSL